MATNEILPFASTDTGTNLLSQSAYTSDSQRLIGNQPGLGRGKLVNKALRQASIMASGLAEFLADNQSNNITDGLTAQDISDYMTAAVQAAAGLSSVVTPPQFDNDTSIATTEFVQRALGNIRGLSTYSVNTTLTAADLGKLIVPVLNNITFNLPGPSTLPYGTKLYFSGNGKTGITISGNGTNFSFGSSGYVPSITLGANDTLELTNVGAWMVTDGTAYLMASTAFTASFGSGYQKLPTGLILQWGLTSEFTANSTLYTTTFPISFPNSCLSIALTDYASTSDYAGIKVQSFTASNFVASKINLQGAATNHKFYFIAIGW